MTPRFYVKNKEYDLTAEVGDSSLENNFKENMNNFSTTQTSNIASFIGVVMLVLNHYKINIGSEELTQLIGACFAVFGVAMNWYHRYQKGDLTFGGFRK